MNILAVIPARGGSKRIKNKNIKSFLSLPIISYSINACKEAEIFDEIMVSTDSEKIGQIATKYGASVPFMRSAENSDDHSTVIDVVLEVIKKYEQQNKVFDYVACVYATAPFISGKVLKEAFCKIKNSDADSILPIVKYSYPIGRALKVKNEKVEMLQPENLNKRSQDLEPSYHDAGQFWIAKTSSVKNNLNVFTKNTLYLELQESKSQDIDSLEDWKLAELKYRIMNKL